MDTSQLIPIPLEDGELWWDPAFIPHSDGQRLLQALESEIDWRCDEIRMFGRSVPIPRLQAWIGDSDCRYRYSGLLLEPSPWTAASSELKQRIEDCLAMPFNAVLANLYRDGNDSVGWHADNEPELGSNPVIASLTLGAERRFSLRHRRNKQRKETLKLPSGSLLVMAGSLQHHWLHALPKSRAPHGPRINLSFRQILQPSST